MVYPNLNPIQPPFSYGFPMVFLWFSYGFHEKMDQFPLALPISNHRVDVSEFRVELEASDARFVVVAFGSEGSIPGLVKIR